MDLKICATHKGGLRASRILKCESKNSNFPLEIGIYLTYNEKFVEFCICNVEFSSFQLRNIVGGNFVIILHISNEMQLEFRKIQWAFSPISPLKWARKSTENP